MADPRPHAQPADTEPEPLPPSDDPDPRSFTLEAAARRLNVEPETVLGWIREHKLGAIKIGRAWILTADHIAHFESRLSASAEPPSSISNDNQTGLDLSSVAGDYIEAAITALQELKRIDGAAGKEALLDRLRLAAKADVATRALVDAVGLEAREAGASWYEMSRSMELTREAVRNRYYGRTQGVERATDARKERRARDLGIGF